MSARFLGGMGYNLRMRKIPFSVMFVGAFLVAVSFIGIFFGLGETPGPYVRNPELFNALKWIQIAIHAVQFAVGFNILAGRNWARYTWLGFAAFSWGLVLVFGTVTPTSLISGLFFFAVFAYALFLDKNADSYFNKSPRKMFPPVSL